MYAERLARIKAKVDQANRLDPERKIFGADLHEYEWDVPASNEEVIRFEEHYNITLPDEYKAFITTLGNGGPGSYGGAGPFYGIYPLGDFGYLEHASKYMSGESVIDSTLTKAKWKLLTAFAEKFDSDSEAYNQYYDRLFSGLMFIGTQGCNFQTMLILNGPDAGRVVYIDQDLQQPIVKEGFLDWYENWVDELLI